MSILNVTVDTPVQIIPGCILRRPTEPELARLKEALSRSGKASLAKQAYEHAVCSGSNQLRPLDPSEWRYWVVEETPEAGHTGEGLRNVFTCSRLGEVELPCDNFAICWRLGAGDEPALMQSSRIGTDPFVRLLPSRGPVDLDSDTVSQIRESWGRFRALDTTSPVHTAIRRFTDLGSLYREDDLYVLGVFGVVESVLTHDPKGGGDRIVHQLGAKMSLLNKRFHPPLDYTCFNGARIDTVWEHLYKYRGQIAHGLVAEFEKKGVFGCASEARGFLEKATKTLLRHALKEPQLLLDLRDC